MKNYTEISVEVINDIDVISTSYDVETERITFSFAQTPTESVYDAALSSTPVNTSLFDGVDV